MSGSDAAGSVAVEPGFVGGSGSASPSHTALPGRTTVHERALRAVSLQAAATTLGVERRAVSVQLASAGGGLALRVAAPLRIVDLDDTAAVHAHGGVLDSIRTLQEQLRARIAHLTGRDVTRVDITVTGAIVPPKKRVR